MERGLVTNIIPKSMMHDLGIMEGELSKSRMMIQGFNLEGQCIMIHVGLIIGNLSTSSIFYAIGTKTSYKLLLGRPMLHENRLVASNLLPCLKYYWRRERKINDNVKPFMNAKSHFTDARFFDEDNAPKETTPSIITSMGKGGTKIILQAPKEDTPTHPLKEESIEGDTSSSVKQVDKKVATSIGHHPSS